MNVSEMNDLERSPRVLVVDDDENVLRLLGIKLRRAGFSVDLAANMDAALAAARAAPPDLAVLGDNLPDGDIDTLTCRLATMGGPGGAVVVLLSARAGTDEIAHGLATGADDYILKPFSPHELAHRLRVVLARRALRANPRPPAEPG